jgi:hypothetical protein
MLYGCFTTITGGTDWITSTFSTEAGTLPTGAISLTQTQYQEIGSTPGWSLVSGVPTPPPANYNLSAYQSAQIALVANQLQMALVAPYSFTTSGGVTSSFPMDAVSQSNYHNAFTAYINGGIVLPSGFFFFDVNEVEVPFTVADIKALYQGLVERGQAGYAAYAKAKKDILAATTVASIQAITLVNP